MYILIPAVAGLFLTCAIHNNDESANRIEPVPVVSGTVDDTQFVGERVEFQAVAQVPNPCWKFNRFDIAQNNREVNVTVMAEYDNQPCAQVIGTIAASGSILLTTPGVYTFKFWRGSEEMLAREVVVQ
jgi:hypothetical protein